MSPTGLIIRRLPYSKRSKGGQEIDVLTLWKLPATEDWLDVCSAAAKTRQQRDSRWAGVKKKNSLWCQPRAKFNGGENIASVWALIGAFGSEAMIAPSSILSTLLPIKKEEGKKRGETLYKWILRGHPRRSLSLSLSPLRWARLAACGTNKLE